MARTTKADLEKRIIELEDQLSKYQQWLIDSEAKYNKLINEKEEQLESLPTYQQMKSHIERLELINKNNEASIAHKKETEKKLRNKIQEILAETKQLEEENEQLKESIKNQTIINDTMYNVRGAGRKPKSIEQIQEQLQQIQSLLAHGKKEKDICRQMNISRATYYRLKKLL